MKKLAEMTNSSEKRVTKVPCITDADFKVLTVNGWKPFTSIRVGDYVYSRVNGKMVESRVNAIVDQPYDGDSYHVKGRHIDCEFTGNHKFLMCNRQDYRENNEEIYTKIRDIYHNRSKYSHNVIPKTAKWIGSDQNDIKLSDLTFDSVKFAGFLGIYLAEGYVRNNIVYITQKNEIGKKLIRDMLDELHPNIKWKDCSAGFCTKNVELFNYLAPLGNKYNKYIPQDIKNLDVKCLEELIHWFAIGDGRMQISEGIGKSSLNCKGNVSENRLNLGKYNRTNVFSVSKQLIDDLHECLIKTGRCGHKSIIITKNDYVYADRVIKASNKKPLYQLEVGRSKFIHMDTRFLNITEKRHTGRIYCLSTEYGNFYMEKNGKSFWTGNCDSIVHFANASHVVTKLWWEGNTLMGEGEILRTPNGEVLRALIQDGIPIGISSRGVGNGKVNENGILVIGDSYKLITFDAVADPSTFAAFQEKVVSRRENYTPKLSFAERMMRSNNYEVKNETYCIDTASDIKAFVACCGGIVNSQVEQIKARL